MDVFRKLLNKAIDKQMRSAFGVDCSGTTASTQSTLTYDYIKRSMDKMAELMKSLPPRPYIGVIENRYLDTVYKIGNIDSSIMNINPKFTMVLTGPPEKLQIYYTEFRNHGIEWEIINSTTEEPSDQSSP